MTAKDAPPSTQPIADGGPTLVEHACEPRLSAPSPSKRTFGKYRAIARLGGDGDTHAYVALARGPVGFGKLVVVRAIRDRLFDQTSLRAFLNEARLASQLHHANIAQTYEVAEHAGRLFVASEYVEGQSLRSVQQRLAPGRLPLAVQLRLLVEVARGLHHAHSLKSFDGKPLEIVHGSVSPENVVVTYEGQVKLLDFGLSQAHQTEAGERDARAVEYAAPEQLAGEAVSSRTDVFSLGVLLFEALTGTRFGTDTDVADPADAGYRARQPEPRLHEVAPNAPPRLVEICTRALSIAPADRHASAADFAGEVAEYLAETSRTDSRRLADLLAPVFEADRARVRALLDEQVRVAESLDADLDEDTLPLVVTATPVHPPATKEIDPPREARAVRPLERGAETSRAARITVVVALGLVTAFVVLRGIVTRDTHSPGVTARPVPTASQSGARPTVVVRISAEPQHAELMLDGARIDAPFQARLEQDGRIHHVVATANGFSRAERALVFDRDLQLHLTLDAVSPTMLMGRPPAHVDRDAPRTQTGDDGPAPVEVAPPPSAPPQREAAMTSTSARPPIERADPY